MYEINKHKINKPKYETEFIQEIKRKAFYKLPIFIQDVKFKSAKDNLKTGGNSRVDIYDKLSNYDFRTRVFSLLYRNYPPGEACNIMRKLLLDDPVNINNVCIKSNDISLDIEKLLPDDAEIENVLLLTNHNEESNTLKNYIVDTSADGKSYDMIILSYMLHHGIEKIMTELSNIKYTYLLIRDLDVLTDDDKLILDFIHGKRLDYLSKSEVIKMMSKNLKLVTENQTRYDPITNPEKKYYLLFEHHTKV
jgi:hypothetical protein